MDFNLQLAKYSLRDLQAMFKLGDAYTASELDEKETVIRSQLVTKGMDDTMKGNLTRFLSEAKALLLKEVSGNLMTPTPPIYVPAKLEEFVAGNVNPYERRTQTKSVCVDSVFRVGQLSTDFTFTLPESIKTAMSMRLAAIELPELQTFSARNQSATFWLRIMDGPTGDATYEVVLPEGSFTLDEMTDILVFAISSHVSYVTAVVTSQATTIRFKTVDEGDSVFDPAGTVYAPTATLNVDFGIEGKSLYTTAGWILGYRQCTYPGPAVSETAFAPATYVFLEVDDFQNNFQTDTVISTNGHSYLGKNVLARIVLRAPPSEKFQKREYFGPVRLDKLHFRLLTRFGEVVDLGGADFSFMLEFTTIYS
jgi:hypothetical protein